MNRGIYTAYTGMAITRAAQEMKAGNLANLSTPGYRADSMSFGSFRHHLLSAVHTPGGTYSLSHSIPLAGVAGISVNTTQASVENTGHPWDLALMGEGFFALEGPEGQVLYTRNGRFGLDGEGNVVNDRGWYLLAENGRIQGEGLSVDSNGNLVNSENIIVDRLLLVRFQSEQLARYSADCFTSEQPGVAASPEVMSGYLEGANVNLVNEMTDMMMLVRSFEMGQRLVQAQDRLLDLAANQIGSLRG